MYEYTLEIDRIHRKKQSGKGSVKPCLLTVDPLSLCTMLGHHRQSQHRDLNTLLRGKVQPRVTHPL